MTINGSLATVGPITSQLTTNAFLSSKLSLFHRKEQQFPWEQDGRRGGGKQTTGRWRDTGEEERCGETIAYRNRKLRHGFMVLFVTLGGNVSLDGGEADRGVGGR